jgi:hypothetical protein
MQLLERRPVDYRRGHRFGFMLWLHAMAYKENIGWLLLKTIVKIPNHSPHPKLNLNKIKNSGFDCYICLR